MKKSELKQIVTEVMLNEGKYPELQKLVDAISRDTLKRINTDVRGVKSSMPYKVKWVLEEVIKELQDRV